MKENYIGKIIKELRDKDSLRDFAKKCNIAHTTIDNIERGIDPRTNKETEPKAKTLQKIANACGENVYIFFEDEKIKPSEDTILLIGKDYKYTRKSIIIDGELTAFNFYEDEPEDLEEKMAELYIDYLRKKEIPVTHEIYYDIQSKIKNTLLESKQKAIEKKTGIKKISYATLKTNIVPLEKNNIYLIPVCEGVAAGTGAIPQIEAIDYTPLYFRTSLEAEETICIKVKGNSMSPKIEDGDIIQVHKQDHIENGQLAVVFIEDEEAVVKKVIKGEDWIELVSLNKEYKPRRFEKEEINRIKIFGEVRKIIKDI